MRRLYMPILLALVALGLAGCGKDYAAPELETTGREPAQLGQIVDVNVSYPELRLNGQAWPGVSFEIRLEIDGDGFGVHPARAFYSDNVEDLSSGTTEVVVSPAAWTVALLGPIRIDGTVLEILLTGESDDDGWFVTGRAFESLTATEGGFDAWRRHRFLVSGSDFFSDFGRVTEVQLIRGDQIVVHDNLELVNSDSTLRVTNGSVFAINRLGFDNLQRLDPRSEFRTAWQESVGDGANPHDALATSGDKTFVTRYEPPFDDLDVLDTGSGEHRSTVPLADLAENPDGTPRPDRMVAAEGLVFVGLQDIDRTFSVFGEGKLAVVDPELEEVVGVIPLGGKNPGAMEVFHGADGETRIYVALAGIFAGLQPQELSGGVVVVNAFDRVVERLALDDDDAGGNIGAFALSTERLAYVVVLDDQLRNRVLAFDPEDGRILRTVSESLELIPELEVDRGGVLAVPDRNSFDPRLCLYRTPTDPAEEERLIGCAGVELPPFSIEALN